MSRQWLLYDRLIQIQPMPSEFAESKANILCCDCNKKSEIAYHFVGLKCADCGSYNTKVEEIKKLLITV